MLSLRTSLKNTLSGQQGRVLRSLSVSEATSRIAKYDLRSYNGRPTKQQVCYCQRVSGEVELGVLLRQHNEFKIGHANVCSLPGSFLDVTSKVDEHSLDIKCFTETWLDQSYPETRLQIPG